MGWLASPNSSRPSRNCCSPKTTCREPKERKEKLKEATASSLKWEDTVSNQDTANNPRWAMDSNLRWAMDNSPKWDTDSSHKWVMDNNHRWVMGNSLRWAMVNLKDTDNPLQVMDNNLLDMVSSREGMANNLAMEEVTDDSSQH